MMNRQIRVEKIIGTVKCVATCGSIEIQEVVKVRGLTLRLQVKYIRLRLFNQHNAVQ